MKRREKAFLTWLGIAFLAIFPVLWKRGILRIPTKIRGLHILGLSHIPAVDFQSLIDIREGGPLLGDWVKTSAEKLKVNPRVGEATISRSLTGDVFVKVAERKASALINLGRLYYVDSEGHLLDPVASGPSKGADLVVISGPWNEKSNTDLIRASVQQAMELKREYLRAGYSEQEISELHYDETDGWVIYRVGSPIRVVIGKSDFYKKVMRLKRVLSDVKGRERGIREVDMDFDDRAIVKWISKK